MRHEEFNSFLEEVQLDQRETLGQKSEQYSSEGDKLRNIRIGWPEPGVPHILHQLGKHLGAIRLTATGESPYTPARFRENCRDARNWIVILEAWMKEASE